MKNWKEEIKHEKDWYQKCLLITSFHTTEAAKKEDKRNNKWTIKDTARELELSIGYVSESIKLVKCGINIEKMTREKALERIRK